MTRRTHARAWKLTKAAVKATDGDDREMLAPTNDGHVIRSANSKAHKWNVQVIANRDELKVIITKYYEHFYLECRGILQLNYSWGASFVSNYIRHGNANVCQTL